jgi:hypothetical protein
MWATCVGVPCVNEPKSLGVWSHNSQNSLPRDEPRFIHLFSLSLSLHPKDCERVEFCVPWGGESSKHCGFRGNLYWHKKPDYLSTTPKKVMHVCPSSPILQVKYSISRREARFLLTHVKYVSIIMKKLWCIFSGTILSHRNAGILFFQQEKEICQF